MNIINNIKTSVRNAINEFMKGFNDARMKQQPISIASVPTASKNPHFMYDYEHIIPTMLKLHGITTDIYVTDKLAGTVMACIATEDKGLVGIEMKNMNDSILIIERDNLNIQHMILPEYDSIFTHITKKELVEIVLAHEIGHLVKNHVHAPEQAYKKEAMANIINMSNEQALEAFTKIGTHTLQQEVEAWHTGRAYVPVRLIPAYEAFNKFNLITYKQAYNTQLGKEVFK